MKLSLALVAAALGLASAAPANNMPRMPTEQELSDYINARNAEVATIDERAPNPTVSIAYPQATIIGKNQGSVEIWPGIPFAHKPVGNLRLKPPVPLTAPLGTIKAQENGMSCPQFIFSTVLEDSIPTAALGSLLNQPFVQQILNAGEDCLYLNVHRPAGTKPGDKLPVLFWIYGGGFELGWNYMYDGAPWVESSVKQDKPMIMVTVNYRLGGK